MRTFISSTVYDLLDIRAELSAMLRQLGIEPIMSDDQLSDFHVNQSKNSIETCLINVDSSDEVIVILDKRYGHRLGKYGFDDISPTHLEYRRAVAQHKPVHVYVRDRLEADFAVWKKNGRRADVSLPWVQNQSDFGLFTFLDEHSMLVGEADRSNWYRTFSNSDDLKICIRKHLIKRILPSRLAEAINANQFPLFEANMTTDVIRNQGIHVMSRVDIQNVGGAAAFHVRLVSSVKADEIRTRDVVGPGRQVTMTFLTPSHTKLECEIVLEAQSMMGISSRSTFAVLAQFVPGHSPGVSSAASLLSREYFHSEPPTLTISELDTD